MVKIGATLKNARITQDKTIADAAAETKIRRDYLQALEDERFEVIGGEAWVRGFIRAYGRWLGLDTTLLVSAYDAQFHKSHSPTAIPGAHHGELPLRERIRQFMPFVIGVALVLIVVGVFVTRNAGGQDEQREAIAPAPVAEPSQSVLAAQPGQGQSGMPEPSNGLPATNTGMNGQPQGEPMRAPTLFIKATRDVRIRVEQGTPSQQIMLKANDSTEVSDPNQVHLYVSDGGGVQIQVNGQPLPTIGGDRMGVDLICEKGKVACEARDRNE
ncbi:helix-turn-helix domain-containing protein [Stomatohabitans albus]|uniref:helix-turn-helix domain-containing protein n=1 Tax=Stomatohabitans albus TaxID=3110766 RepID=UPI00300CA584